MSHRFLVSSALLAVVLAVRARQWLLMRKPLHQLFTGKEASSGKPAVRCGTRKSALAMVQTRWVCGFLTSIHPSLSILVLDGVDTQADKILNVSLKQLVINETATAKPSPGLFTKELEEGLAFGKYDFCVHSLKDVPTTLPEGMMIAAICEREDARDCIVFPHAQKLSLKELKPGSVVGTSSVRREAMLRRDFPGLVIKLIRGNVQTRLQKLDSGEFDAILLAVAGLVRLGLEHRIGQIMDPTKFPYGVSQGSLGIECRQVDVELQQVLGGIQHQPSAQRCLCERALLRELEGGCQVPLGVATRVYRNHNSSGDSVQDWLEIHCEILSLDGRITVQGSMQGPAVDCERMGVALARQLRDELGGKHLIKSDTDLEATWENISKPTTNKRPITFGSAENPLRCQQQDNQA
ncbi:porphobilinogen deaminase [Batrachochytrium salamandrivorans]|nr:porphobilinogen deaminase [Batrachochytrium salamandrivorans]